MKKVLFLIHDLGYGGAEKILVNLANNLDKNRFDITIKTLFDVGSNKQFINNDVHYIGGWKHMFRGNAPLMSLFSPKTLCKWVIKDNYDIVVSFLEGPSSRIVSGYEGKKVTWIHTEIKNDEMLKIAYKSKQEAVNCYNSFDKIVCVADTIRKKFISLFDVMPECITLYNVNDTDYIEECAMEEQEIITRGNVLNIIAVGRLISVKRFERLISIHKKLIDNGVEQKFYILGEGEEHQKLQKQIDDLGVSETCKLLGFENNPYKYLANANLFVCSSEREGFSTAVTEALVLGIPVVSTEVSGAKELLGYNNEYGIVTDNNENALYEGMYKMLTKDGLLTHYKKQAEIRGKEFSTEKTTKAVEEMLESL